MVPLQHPRKRVLEYTRELEKFLGEIERRAFRMAQIALHDPDDALDVVQDAMLKLARSYASRPSAEWRPLFYRILENGIRDLQRRRSVRKRFMTWLPGPKEDPDNEAQDPLDTVADTAPAIPEVLMQGEAMQQLETSLAGPAGTAAGGVHAAEFRRFGCGGDGRDHGLLPRQRQDALFAGGAQLARTAGRGVVMNERLRDPFEERSLALFNDSVESLDMRLRSRLTQARHAALAAAVRRPWFLRIGVLTPAAGVTAAALLGAVLWFGSPPDLMH